MSEVMYGHLTAEMNIVYFLKPYRHTVRYKKYHSQYTQCSNAYSKF